ncbi:fluoride efflux transporter FluC [Aphanothece minutissima]|uniref:Fluoride-specific ion channel FluC n=1 Tax=Aphanothece cf. minutissima CCALA 015 TaxID=2107695 RepID=A0ABX5F9N1_9CHRO|nr:CrcB family protein [Aphanothece minutissima]PSB38519.1 CrcB family protein [Aphanothece cf. minutissima CCALA 015]
MAPPPSDSPASLRREARDLLLVAAGAVPGALLRWRLEDVGKGLEGVPTGLIEADLVANLVGTFLIGVIAAQRPPRPRLLLLGAIGFCGSLTTFSSWMLEISLALRRGRPDEALAVVLVSLLGGLAAVTLGLVVGRWLGRFRLRR